VAGDSWADADAYERYIGRWSRPVADRFLAWLGVRPGAIWVDVGSGTGALSERILGVAAPARVLGVEPSAAFAEAARSRLAGGPASFEVGRAEALPVPDGVADAVVFGLVINFVPDVPAALAESRRVARPAGLVAAYLWDYADRMELIRRFWDAAVALDPEAAELDEGRRFPIASRDGLAAAWSAAGLSDVETASIEVPTRFADFDDYWRPFTTTVAPAPGYASSLPEARRDALRERLRSTLPIRPDGSIDLVARAWAVRGTS
jgi:SAM-dependent methyltransferase